VICLVSSINKTDHYNITDKLLKISLIPITLTLRITPKIKYIPMMQNVLLLHVDESQLHVLS
jgi:hypothetical protein